MTISTPSFKEDHISQIPTIQLLINLGYKYITPEQVLNQRKGKKANKISNRLSHFLKKIKSNACTPLKKIANEKCMS